MQIQRHTQRIYCVTSGSGFQSIRAESCEGGNAFEESPQFLVSMPQKCRNPISKGQVMKYMEER